MAHTKKLNTTESITWNYYILYEMFSVLGFIYALTCKGIKKLICDLFYTVRSMPKRHGKRTRPPVIGVNEEMISKPAYLRKSHLCAREWEKRNLSEFMKPVRPADCFDIETALTILYEEELALWELTSQSSGFEEDFYIEMVYDHVY